jgi:hypothetical protein
MSAVIKKIGQMLKTLSNGEETELSEARKFWEGVIPDSYCSLVENKNLLKILADREVRDVAKGSKGIAKLVAYLVELTGGKEGCKEAIIEVAKTLKTYELEKAEDIAERIAFDCWLSGGNPHVVSMLTRAYEDPQRGEAPSIYLFYQWLRGRKMRLINHGYQTIFKFH